MSFASAAFLGLLGLGLPIALLYVLKVRRRPVTVPYLRLWEELVAETRARSLFQRLKRLLSLLLQLLILAGLVLALAEPVLELGSAEKESIVVLIDGSASMQAVEADGRTRFEHALERAGELVEGRSFEDEMLLALVSDRVDVLSPFERSTIRLRGALARAAVTNRSLDAVGALEFAQQVTAGREIPVVLFLSDGAAGAVEEALARGGGEPAAEEDGGAGEDGGTEEDGAAGNAAGRVAHLPVGEATENVGITRFSARKNTSLGTDYVLAVVRNFGAEERTVELEIALDGVSRRVLTRTLAAGAEVVERLQMTLPEGGTLRLETRVAPPDPSERSAPGDALALDDVAYAVVHPLRRRRLVLVTETPEEMEPFRIAFAAMREVVDETSLALTAAEYAELDDDARRADLTVCLNVLPEGLAGNLLLIHTPPPAGGPLRVDGVDARPAVWDWDREHVLNRYLNWRDLPLPPAQVVRVDGGDVLVEGYEGALISTYEREDGRTIHVAFDVTGSLFPFRLAFPILLRNAIAWFELEQDALLEDHYAPGATITPLVRLGASKVVAAWFAGDEVRERELELHGGRFLFTDTEEPGPYLFTIDGAREHATAVNLFDARESDVAPRAPAEDARELAAASAGLFNRDLWVLLASAALLLWSLEWATYHRRWTE